MYNLVLRPPRLAIFTDASKSAFGGFCAETGAYFRRALTSDEQSRFVGSSKSVEGVDDISINVLPEAGNRVQLRGDNEDSVAWIQRCRGGKEPRSSALMRMLGAIEVSSGWLFQSSHVPGVLNSIADGISRWQPDDVYDNLCAAAPHVRWQEVESDEAAHKMCSAVLGSTGGVL
ncbi:unnamed protein product [Ectocarpus sp. CCAP 1310/34]|nr:unnamed protein product [Ectocarpus sp. CCAP 1310/34]